MTRATNIITRGKQQRLVMTSSIWAISVGRSICVFARYCSRWKMHRTIQACKEKGWDCKEPSDKTIQNASTEEQSVNNGEFEVRERERKKVWGRGEAAGVVCREQVLCMWVSTLHPQHFLQAALANLGRAYQCLFSFRSFPFTSCLYLWPCVCLFLPHAQINFNIFVQPANKSQCYIFAHAGNVYMNFLECTYLCKSSNT